MCHYDIIIAMKTALRVLNELIAEKVIKDYAIGGAMGAMFYMEDLLDKFGMSKEKMQWLQ